MSKVMEKTKSHLGELSPEDADLQRKAVFQEITFFCILFLQLQNYKIVNTKLSAEEADLQRKTVFQEICLFNVGTKYKAKKCNCFSINLQRNAVFQENTF